MQFVKIRSAMIITDQKGFEICARMIDIKSNISIFEEQFKTL